LNDDDGDYAESGNVEHLLHMMEKEANENSKFNGPSTVSLIRKAIKNSTSNSD
jgi:hypothetical protein